MHLSQVLGCEFDTKRRREGAFVDCGFLRIFLYTENNMFRTTAARLPACSSGFSRDSAGSSSMSLYVIAMSMSVPASSAFTRLTCNSRETVLVLLVPFFQVLKRASDSQEENTVDKTFPRVKKHFEMKLEQFLWSLLPLKAFIFES